MEHFLQENKSIKASSECKPPSMSCQIICLQWSKWLCPKPRTKKRKSNWRLLWSRSRQWWRSCISMWSSKVVKDRLRTIIPLSNLDQFTYYLINIFRKVLKRHHWCSLSSLWKIFKNETKFWGKWKNHRSIQVQYLSK